MQPYGISEKRRDWETNRVESDVRYFDNLLTQFRNFRKSNDELSVQSITAHSVWPYKNQHKYFLLLICCNLYCTFKHEYITNLLNDFCISSKNDIDLGLRWIYSPCYSIHTVYSIHSYKIKQNIIWLRVNMVSTTETSGFRQSPLFKLSQLKVQKMFDTWFFI